jgi:hypothetical protein
VFDKVKVLVETTTEFPLDIQCKLLFSEDDLKLYHQLKGAEQYLIKEQDQKKGVQVVISDN